MPATNTPKKTRRVRVTIEADLVESQEGSHLLRFITGLGDPEFRVTDELHDLPPVAPRGLDDHGHTGASGLHGFGFHRGGGRAVGADNIRQ